MNMTSILKTAVASASLMAASTVLAAPVITMTGTATQQITMSSCKTLKTPMTVTVTFDDDGTYDVVDDNSTNTVLQGTWFKLSGKTATSPYTIYMAASVFAPSPFDPDVHASPNPTIPPPAGTLDDFLDQVEATIENGMTCKLNTKKPPLGSQSIDNLVQPSILVVTNTLKVTTAKDGVTKSGTLTFKTNKGKATHMFTGKSKVGSFSASLTMKGPVVD
ncbi:MAG: hypothetical protein R3E61_03315 [Pseudomonadales bacterium]